MTRTTFRWIWILGLMAMSLPSAWAAKFANQFAEFELPPQWQCSLEGAEWVCQSTIDAKKKEAIIVLAAKLKGDQDGLEQYLAHLKEPKLYTSVAGKPVKSEPKAAKTIEYNGHPWIDALHLDSEIPGYYTRYLATVKSDIGVLVTFSVLKSKYQDYLQDFDNLVKTLQVFRKAGGINAKPGGDLFAQVPMPPSITQGTVFPGPGSLADTGGAPTRPRDDSSMLYLVMGGAAIAFLIWKRKQNRG